MTKTKTLDDFVENCRLEACNDELELLKALELRINEDLLKDYDWVECIGVSSPASYNFSAYCFFYIAHFAIKRRSGVEGMVKSLELLVVGDDEQNSVEFFVPAGICSRTRSLTLTELTEDELTFRMLGFMAL